MQMFPCVDDASVRALGGPSDARRLGARMHAAHACRPKRTALILHGTGRRRDAVPSPAVAARCARCARCARGARRAQGCVSWSAQRTRMHHRCTEVTRCTRSVRVRVAPARCSNSMHVWYPFYMTTVGSGRSPWGSRGAPGLCSALGGGRGRGCSLVAQCGERPVTARAAHRPRYGAAC